MDDGQAEAFARSLLTHGSELSERLRASDWLPPADRAKTLYSWFMELAPDIEGGRAALPSIPSNSSGFLSDASLTLSDNMTGALVWLLALAVCGLAAWRLLLHYPETRPSPMAIRNLPEHWPVSPERVTTRGDLVRAFEYLALLCLGIEASHRHHLELARRLGETGHESGMERRQAARQLAYLYELARYAPEDESLSETEMAAARRDLSYLAGAGAA